MPEFVVDFPTLWIVPDWIEAHVVVPDRAAQGDPLELYDWQLYVLANHYRIKEDAEPDPRREKVASKFHFRRSQVVMPQKSGKGPFAAAMTIAEAVGPTVFIGWAKGGERYYCSDHGCGCGWVYEYEAGEPMAEPRKAPLIQLLAASEDQVQDNLYRPVQSMLKLGPLAARDDIKVGEDFIRLPNMGRIDVVTSSATSRLGNPITFAAMDETHLYTKTNKMVKVAQTMRRGLSGMSGRSLETTNAWDPSEYSTAQQTAEANAPDVFRFHPMAPAQLSFKNKQERRKIYRYVYAGSSHVDFDAIDAEVAELMQTDPAQAERFFGNRIVSGSDAWIEPAAWAACESPRAVKDGTQIVLGFDGSDVDDWSAIRAETMDGYQFTPTYGPNKRPTVWNPADFGGQTPRLEIDAAVDELFRRYRVIRMYCDPPYWESEVDRWAEKYGEKRVIRWLTRRLTQMHDAAERLKTDITRPDSGFTHDSCPFAREHVGNARAAARTGDRYVLVKPSDAQKIDVCITSILAHEAAGDVRAAGLAKKKPNYVYTA
ncbi:MAG: hypothetical protein IRZ03_08520 [Acidobacterium ailaaui]|nr:hypothetical protein [Pseudacidobacterium ailaaui]